MFGERPEVPHPQEGYSDLSVLVRRDVVQAQKKQPRWGFVPIKLAGIHQKSCKSGWLTDFPHQKSGLKNKNKKNIL